MPRLLLQLASARHFTPSNVKSALSETSKLEEQPWHQKHFCGSLNSTARTVAQLQPVWYTLNLSGLLGRGLYAGAFRQGFYAGAFRQGLVGRGF